MFIKNLFISICSFTVPNKLDSRSQSRTTSQLGSRDLAMLLVKTHVFSFVPNGVEECSGQVTFSETWKHDLQNLYLKFN